MTFDETNAKILALLQRDSSLTNEAIGSEVNLSSTTVIKRVKKLRDSGIIEATVAVLSLQAAGPIVSALVLCSFDPDGAATIDQFAQTLLSRPETRDHECLGGHGRGGRCPPGPHPHG